VFGGTTISCRKTQLPSLTGGEGQRTADSAESKLSSLSLSCSGSSGVRAWASASRSGRLSARRLRARDLSARRCSQPVTTLRRHTSPSNTQRGGGRGASGAGAGAGVLLTLAHLQQSWLEAGTGGCLPRRLGFERTCACAHGGGSTVTREGPVAPPWVPQGSGAVSSPSPLLTSECGVCSSSRGGGPPSHLGGGSSLESSHYLIRHLARPFAQRRRA
jgi:hypothetical protein